MKSEVETVIKTGRQIVQKQQTENPKELDERLTALKLQYNELGAKVSSVFLIENYAPFLTGEVKNNFGTVSKWVFLLVPFKAITFSKRWDRKNGGKGNHQDVYSVALRKNKLLEKYRIPLLQSKIILS